MEKFTLGVEEEYMVVNPLTRELASHDQQIVELAAKTFNDQVKAEMHQAVVEAGSGICRDAEEAREDIKPPHRRVRNAPVLTLVPTADHTQPTLRRHCQRDAGGGKV
jgi:gamma-glutamyl:cysteine ligase YbdK (ATP-grasp superfamily)